MSQHELTDSLHKFTASDIVRTIHAGKATCEDVARACLARIEAREPEVQAWQYLNPDQVIAAARALDKRGGDGPLYGVPFGIKDIIDTCDMPTEYGSPIYKGYQPASDAACVALSRKAGGLLMGKTVTTEFANVYPGKTRHPLDPSRTPGGSSSGSAAAVGDFMVPLAIGTQTTASTIRPASFNGIFGYRPTYGGLRCAGVKEAAGSLDTIGLLARSVEDISLYRDVLLLATPTPLPLINGTALRIGFCPTHLWPRLEPSTAKLLEGAADQLGKVGASLEEVTLPSEFNDVIEVHRAISSYEFARNFTYEIENHWDQISLPLRDGRIATGLKTDIKAYTEARRTAEANRRTLDKIMWSYDVLLTASAAGEAPKGLTSTGDASFCALWTTMHVPSITIPVFTGPNGLPVGTQLIGKRGEDRALLTTAQWVVEQFQ
jgi:amidase